MTLSSSQFDREFQLDELIPSADRRRIEAALSMLTGRTVRVSNAGASLEAGCLRGDIIWELEILGHIDIEAGSDEEMKGATEMMQLLVKSAARFQMASDLHIETVHADYERLQEKHAALKKSEARYKDLAQQLELKVAEQVESLQDAQTKMYQSAKLASVGRLAAGVAHEINTPLAYIQSNLSSAVSYLEDLQTIAKLITGGADSASLKDAWESEDMEYVMDDFPHLLQDSLQGVEKAASIVADLKLFSNIDKSEQMVDDINHRLQTVVNMIRPQLSDQVGLKFEQQTDLPEILCYPAHLGQVFYNLILNGAQAIAGAGEVSIYTEKLGEEICVSIRDTGAGIAESDLPRIFDHFFTTREVGQGVGLGLTVINDIIKAHGGRIEVTSRIGEGSVFTVFLPIEGTRNNG